MCYNFQNKGVDLKKAMNDLDAEEFDTTNLALGSINSFSKQEKPTIPAIVNHNGIILTGTFWGSVENPDVATKGKNLLSENTYT
jgi:hypothetical protein